MLIITNLFFLVRKQKKKNNFEITSSFLCGIFIVPLVTCQTEQKKKSVILFTHRPIHSSIKIAYSFNLATLTHTRRHQIRPWFNNNKLAKRRDVYNNNTIFSAQLHFSFIFLRKKSSGEIYNRRENINETT